MPLVEALAAAFPGTSPLMDAFRSNYEYWQVRIAQAAM
jgi:hypothetical protein